MTFLSQTLYANLLDSHSFEPFIFRDLTPIVDDADDLSKCDEQLLQSLTRSFGCNWVFADTHTHKHKTRY